jgi:phosphate transport system substrate-binding protein
MHRILAIIFAVIGLVIHPAWAGKVILHGSTTVANAFITPHKTEIEQRSGQQLVIVGNGSQRGIVDLVAGRAQIAISVPLAEVARKVNEKTPGTVDAAQLKAYHIGESSVAFAVHPTNTVRALTNGQLADVLTGKVRNWKELGGADREIIIVTALPGDGLRTMVETELIEGDRLPSTTRAMPNATQVAKVVAQLPGGIGIVAPLSLDDSVAELRGDREVTQPLFLVTAGEEASDTRCVVEAAAIAEKSSHTQPTVRAEMETSCAN